MAEKAFGLFTPGEVASFIKARAPTLSEKVLEVFVAENIDGEVFLELNDEQLREIVPLFGDRLKIKLAVKAAKSLLPTSSSCNIIQESSSCSSITTTPDVAVLSPAVSPAKVSVTSVNSDSEDSDCLMDCSDVDEKVPPNSTKPETEAKSTDVKIENPGSKQVSADWAENIVIPSRFSTKTNEALKEGRVPNGSSRDEIIKALSTVMLVHTMNPTSSDYNVVCKRLVDKHPILKDHVGSGYDSWKRKLSMKFKNLRRPSRAGKAGVTPPRRKTKPDAAVFMQPSTSDVAEYEQHLKHIQKSYKSKKWSVTSMTILLEHTAGLRRRWIQDEFPTVKDVIEKFPCLTEPKLIMYEFCNITGCTEKEFSTRWLDTMSRVISYASREDRKAVKAILAQYNSIDGESSDDRTSSYVLKLLAALLCPRGKGKSSIMDVFAGEHVTIEECIKKVEQRAPFIAAFGLNFDELSDFKVVIEKENMFSMPSLVMALKCCFASYFVYNISYPPDLSPILLFIEHVFKIKPTKKLPISVTILIEAIGKL